jgi:hypothetical protein
MTSPPGACDPRPGGQKIGADLGQCPPYGPGPGHSAAPGRGTWQKNVVGLFSPSVKLTDDARGAGLVASVPGKVRREKPGSSAPAGPASFMSESPMPGTVGTAGQHPWPPGGRWLAGRVIQAPATAG